MSARRTVLALALLLGGAAPLPAQRVEEIQVAPLLLRLRIGAAARAQATGYDSNGNPLDVRFWWGSSNINVATVDSTGTVRAVAPGVAIITASIDSSGGRRRSGRLTVLVQGATSSMMSPPDGKRMLSLDTVIPAECAEPEFSVRNAGRACWDTRPSARASLVLEVPSACSDPAVRPEALYVRVSDRGEVTDVQLLNGSNCQAYSQAAGERVRAIGFTPAHRGGRPVNAWTMVVVRPPARTQTWPYPMAPAPPAMPGMPAPARPTTPAPGKLPPRP